jgi:hypothetical protein
MNKFFCALLNFSWLSTGVALASSISIPVHALPALQLDLLGGTYDTSEESVITSVNKSTLFAYCDLSKPNCFSQPYYVSIAVIPKGTNTDFGSFIFNGQTYIKNDLTFGTPPLDDIDLGATDAGDLASHGVFETLFTQVSFNFNSSKTRSAVNVQDLPGTDPTKNLGKGLAYAGFNFDVSGLKDGYDLHFDLYSEQVVQCAKKKPNCTSGDVDVDQFAPFSHDATAKNPPNNVPAQEVPEPNLMMGLVAVGLGAMTTRRQKLF